MHLSIVLLFALKILGVENRAQVHQVLDPSGADLSGLDAPPNSNCICTPFQSCYDNETNSNIKDIVDDRIMHIENRQAITFGQENKPADCPDFLDVCCYNLVPLLVTTPSTNPSPQPQPPSPSQISTQTQNVPLPVTIAPPRASNGGCGVRNSDGVGFTIQGFTDGQAQYGEFPWMVAVLTSAAEMGAKNLYVGGGSLVDPLVVLTAAHKPFDSNKTLTVRIGEWNFREVSEPNQHQDIPVTEIIYHPRFNRNQMAYNYALLVLERPAQLGETVGTICLPSNPRQRFNGEQCIISGWGKDIFGEEGRHQRILKSVSVNMVEYSQCQSAMRTTHLGSNFTLHRSFVCAGDQGQDACTGDGGSPLVCPDPTAPGQYVQVGISSWGIGCGQPGLPGVYSAVAPAVEWIQDTINTINAQAVGIRTVFFAARRCSTHEVPYVEKCEKCADCEECYRFNARTCRCHKKFRCRPESFLKNIDNRPCEK